MTGELKTATENLYTTFSVYPSKSTIEGCPCCVSGSDKEKIHSKPLRDLDEDDLSRYAFKAMTTWGDTDDFRHFLPRIFELSATTNFIVDPFVVLGKLEYGKWLDWPDAEKNAISRFLLAWWTESLMDNPGFDKELFIEIYKLTGNITELLTCWAINFEDNSFSNFVDLIHNYYSDLTSKRKDFRELDSTSAGLLLEWIRNNSAFLERGFFHFAEKDPMLAEKISTTQYIFERN